MNQFIPNISFFSIVLTLSLGGSSCSVSLVSMAGRTGKGSASSIGTPASIVKSSGDSQTGVATSYLPIPFFAVVRDADANVVSGVIVDWAVTAGGGSLSSASSITDTSGQSSTILTLGAGAGSNTVTATVRGTGISTTFSATSVMAFNLANDSGMVQKNASATTLGVLANDVHNLSLSFSITSVTQPTNGSVVNNGSNLTYQPNPGFTGVDSFTYTVTDTAAHSQAASVSVKVMSNFTWTGMAGTGLWATAGNWCGTVSTPGLSGTCAGSASAPSASDIAVFDATCSSNCSTAVAANISVLGVLLDTGYSGTLTQNTARTITLGSSGWNQKAGNFQGSDASISMSSGASFSLTGGSFTSTSGVFLLCGDWTVSGTGSFSHNNGTIQQGCSAPFVYTLTPGSSQYYNVTMGGWGTAYYLTGTWKVVNLVLSDGFGAANNLTGCVGYVNLCGGVIEVTGNLSNFGGGWRGKEIKLVGSGVQTITGNAGANFPTIEVASSGTVNLAGTIIIYPFAGKSFTYTSGVLVAGTSTLTLASDTSAAETFRPGPYSFFDVNIRGWGTTHTITGTLYLTGSLTLSDWYGLGQMSGNIVTSGNVFITSFGIGGSVAIEFTGNTNISVSVDPSAAVPTGAVTVNKTAGSMLSLASHATAFASTPWSVSSGSVNMATYNLSTQSLSLSSNVLTKNGGTLTVGGSVIGTGSLFGGTVNP